MNALSQRDAFASAALTGLLANYSGQAHSEEDFARWAYRLADAMEEESKNERTEFPRKTRSFATKGGSHVPPQ